MATELDDQHLELIGNIKVKKYGEVWKYFPAFDDAVAYLQKKINDRKKLHTQQREKLSADRTVLKNLKKRGEPK